MEPGGPPPLFFLDKAIRSATRDACPKVGLVHRRRREAHWLHHQRTGGDGRGTYVNTANAPAVRRYD